MIHLPSSPVEGATALRELLDPFLSKKTAYPGIDYQPGDKAKGHCAILTLIYYYLYNGTMASTIINGQSHWFNQITILEQEPKPLGYDIKLVINSYHVDLTLDQFGGAQVTILPKIHHDFRQRTPADINQETALRAIYLLRRTHNEYLHSLTLTPATETKLNNVVEKLWSLT